MMLLFKDCKAPLLEVFAKCSQEKKEEKELEGQDELATPQKVQVCSHSHTWKNCITNHQPVRRANNKCQNQTKPK